MKKNKCYRIVRDYYLRFEVQEKKKFIFSWWKQLDKKEGALGNSFTTIEAAKQWIEQGCPKIKAKKIGEVLWVTPECK